MTTEVREMDSSLDDDDDDAADPPPPARARRTWIVGLVILALVAATVGTLAVDETRTNTRFDRDHAALEATRAQIAVAAGDLASVRHDLDTVNGQVAVDATALDNDTTKLDGAKTALAHASTDLSLENLAVAGLHTCLGGVEQALNALATGDQNQAVSALEAVAGSCAGAVGTRG